MNAATMKKCVVTILLALWAGFGCCQTPASSSATGGPTSSPSQAAAATKPVGDIAVVSTDIAREVGEVQQTIPQGTKGPVFVFEEYHTSRLGQLQIAVMLQRLYERHGLRLIGLEGAFQRPKPLDASWFHNAGGATGQPLREDVAVRMLAEGEISAAEFMALLFSQVQVRGIESEEEYNVRPDAEDDSVVICLLKIAEKKLTQADILKVNDLIENQKEKEAFDYMKNADPWVRRQFEAFEQNSVSVSIPDLARQLREIQDEAQKSGVELEPNVRDGLQKTLQFYEMAMQRSKTMTKNLVDLLGSSSNAPVAMIIGAGHSKEVMDQLQSQDVSCALLRPIALNPTTATLSMEEFERKNDIKWARISDGTLGRILNGQRKPPTIIETATAQSYASAYMAVALVGESVRAGGNVPNDVRAQLTGLPGLRVDFDSFEHDGDNVIFRMWPTGIDGQEKEVWARVGTSDTREEARTVEEKMLQAIADLGGGGKKPPQDPPRDSEATKDKEGPGDGKRGDVVISRVGLRSVAVFATTKAGVTAVGRING